MICFLKAWFPWTKSQLIHASILSRGKTVFQDVQTKSGIHEATHRNGTGNCLPGSNANGFWTWTLHVKIKNERSYTSTSQYALMLRTGALLPSTTQSFWFCLKKKSVSLRISLWNKYSQFSCHYYPPLGILKCFFKLLYITDKNPSCVIIINFSSRLANKYLLLLSISYPADFAPAFFNDKFQLRNSPSE
jgi:hypothetical protein